jgi:hypothetical protein
MLDRGRAVGEDPNLVQERTVVLDESLVDRLNIFWYFFDFHTSYSCHGFLLQDGRDSVWNSSFARKGNIDKKWLRCQFPIDSI